MQAPVEASHELQRVELTPAAQHLPLLLAQMPLPHWEFVEQDCPAVRRQSPETTE